MIYNYCEFSFSKGITAADGIVAAMKDPKRFDGVSGGRLSKRLPQQQQQQQQQQRHGGWLRNVFGGNGIPQQQQQQV